MKKLIILAALCLILKPLMAQKVVEKHMSFAQKESVNLDIQIADSIVVHTWDKDEVYAKASIDINDNKDNDLYLTEFDDSSNVLRVTAKFKENLKGHCSMQSNIAWDVFIPKSASCRVKTISGNVSVYGPAGSLDVHTISGNVIITGKATDVEAHSISGFVDLTVSPDKKADLEFKSISGTIYTDYELKNPVKNKPGSTKVADQMNGGGAKIALATISGNIYFRTK